MMVVEDTENAGRRVLDLDAGLLQARLSALVWLNRFLCSGSRLPESCVTMLGNYRLVQALADCLPPSILHAVDIAFIIVAYVVVLSNLASCAADYAPFAARLLQLM